MPVAQQGFIISTSAQINPGTILGTDIANNTIGDANIAAHTTTKITNGANSITRAMLETGTQGGVLVYGASGAATDIGAGSSGQFLKSQGAGATAIWGTSSNLIGKDLTGGSVSNSTTETTVFTLSIPGGTLGTSNVVRIRGHVNSFTNSAGFPTVSMRFKYGGTTMTTNATLNPNGANVTGLIEILLWGNGSTSSQSANIYLKLHPDSETVTSTGGIVWTAQQGGSAAVDSTTSQTASLTVQFSTNNAGSFNASNWFVEVI